MVESFSLQSCYNEELKKVEQHITDLKNQQKVKKKPKIENRRNNNFKYIQGTSFSI